MEHLLVSSHFHCSHIALEGQLSNGSALIVVPQNDLILEEGRVLSTANKCENIASE